MAKMIGNIIKRLNLLSTLTALEHNIMLNLTILLLYGPRVDYKTPHLSVHGLAPKGVVRVIASVHYLAKTSEALLNI